VVPFVICFLMFLKSYGVLRFRVLSISQRGEWLAALNNVEAAIAQLGERQTEDLKAPGSIPGLGTCPLSACQRRRTRRPRNPPFGGGLVAVAPGQNDHGVRAARSVKIATCGKCNRRHWPGAKFKTASKVMKRECRN
jgi:hypothetical protein